MTSRLHQASPSPFSTGTTTRPENPRNASVNIAATIPRVSEIGKVDVLGEMIGREKCFGAVKGKVSRLSGY
jgi:hypothetical protein